MSEAAYATLRSVVRWEGFLTFGFLALISLLKSMEHNSPNDNSGAPFVVYAVACLVASWHFKTAEKTGIAVLSILAALPFVLFGGAYLWQQFR